MPPEEKLDIHMMWKKRMLRFQNFVSKISFDDVDQISLEHMKGNQNEKTLPPNSMLIR